MLSSQPPPTPSGLPGPGYPPFPGPAAAAGSRRDRALWIWCPLWSVGLGAWVPSLRLAIRRGTRAAWLAFAGFAVGSVVEGVLAETVKSDSSASSAAGGYFLALSVGGTVHAWFANRAPAGPPPGQAPPDGRGQGYGYGYGSNPAYGYSPTQPFPQPEPHPHHLAAPATPAVSFLPPQPPPMDSTAAEVQAGLRELREFLDHGEQP